MGVTREQLQDGRVLTYLIQQFIKEPKKENLIRVFRCLRDSNVWIPMNMELSKEDEEQFKQAQKGDTITTKEGIRLRPEVVKGQEGVSYLPVFSRKDEMPKQFQENNTIVHVSFMECIQIVKRMSHIDEIVLNGYTNGKSIKLDLQYLEAIEQLPSELTSEKEDNTVK